MRVCGCGEIKRAKVGTRLANGVEVCNACGLPAEFVLSQAMADRSAQAIVPPERITTLASLPGYRVVKVLGVVAEVTSASGWTAEQKGTAALSDGMRRLGNAGRAVGANAIIGLQASTFGARGGVTSVVGGDAVGVLLIGTAAMVEAEDSPDGT